MQSRRRPKREEGTLLEEALLFDKFSLQSKKLGRFTTSKKQGNPVPKQTKVAGKRAGGALRSEQKRQQKRRDSR